MQNYLYRLFHNDELLYVGITGSLDQRLHNHSVTKQWWPDVTHTTVQTYESRDELEQAESAAILAESPRYNETVKKNFKVPGSTFSRQIPKSFAPLPPEELEHLKTLSSEDTYIRCAELQAAGWSIPAILQGAKVAPTSNQLRSELKYIHNPKSGVPVPTPPPSEKTRRELARKDREARTSHLTAAERAKLVEYARVSRTLRSHHTPGNVVWDTVQEYREYLLDLYDRGVPTIEMADAAGVNQTNILKRLREARS